MADPRFFTKSGSYTLRALAEQVDAEMQNVSDVDMIINDVTTLDSAGEDQISFLDNPKYITALEKTNAGAVVIAPRNASHAPTGVALLVSPDPYRAFAKICALYYPGAMMPKHVLGTPGMIDAMAAIHPTAKIGEGVTVEAGAAIGANAVIGANSVITANAVIGAGVVIGSDNYIGPHASVTHALVGDRVILHAGVRVGNDGYGFAMSPQGHLKIPQLGRVIIHNDVEIGANSTIDRGAIGDTIIGEGTKIDNLVQIAHNVTLGCHCIIVAQVGISGSTKLGNFVSMGGQSATTGHITIGAGSQIAARGAAMRDVPPGSTYGGAPAKPIRQWLKELVIVERLAKKDDDKEGKKD